MSVTINIYIPGLNPNHILVHWILVFLFYVKACTWAQELHEMCYYIVHFALVGQCAGNMSWPSLSSRWPHRTWYRRSSSMRSSPQGYTQLPCYCHIPDVFLSAIVRQWVRLLKRSSQLNLCDSVFFRLFGHSPSKAWPTSFLAKRHPSRGRPDWSCWRSW